jgi:hypothetical protein
MAGCEVSLSAQSRGVYGGRGDVFNYRADKGAGRAGGVDRQWREGKGQRQRQRDEDSDGSRWEGVGGGRKVWVIAAAGEEVEGWLQIKYVSWCICRSGREIDAVVTMDVVGIGGEFLGGQSFHEMNNPRQEEM